MPQPTPDKPFSSVNTEGPSQRDPPTVPCDLLPNTTNDVQPATLSPLPSSDAGAPQPVVAGYEIEGMLGRGGMGVVYKARQLSLKRTVALKMIRSGSHADNAERHRFHAEAESVARLQHPNIVQIYEIGKADGDPFFSLEYVEGGSLSDKLVGQPLPPEEAATLAVLLARAMHYCHQRGVIHRDLKPANVLLTRDGQPKITDFGLAKLLEGDGGQTHSDALLGTPRYMAPEQAAGKVRQIGPHTDVYALGAILYQMLTGRPPFHGESNEELLHLIRVVEPTTPSRWQPRLPRDLETICLKCLAKEPERRYHSALALAQDLERFLSGEPILGRRAGLVSKLGRRLRRHPAISASLFVVLVTLAVAAAIAVAALRSSRDAALHREIVERENSFRDGLAEADWTREHYEKLIKQADELERLAPEPGAQARQQLVRRLVEVAAESFAPPKKPTLKAADISYSEELIKLVEVHDAARARRLRDELQKRLASRTLVLDLSEAMNRLPAVFAGAVETLQRDGTALRRKQHPASAEIVGTNVPFQGDVEVEARVRFWESAARVGVFLGAAASPDYEFVLTVVPRSDKERGQLDSWNAASLGEALKPPDGAVAMRLSRRGRLLRDRTIRIGSGPLVLRAVRQGQHLAFEVRDSSGKSFPLEIHDLFPLGQTASGVCGLRWQAGVCLDGLRIWRQTLPPAASPLERGDEAFARRQFADALSEYRAAAQSLPDGELLQELHCKEAMCLVETGQGEEAAKRFAAVMSQPDSPWSLFAACQLWPLHIHRRHFADADTVFTWLSAHYPAEQAVNLIPEDLRERMRAAYNDLLRGFVDRDASYYHLLQYDPQRPRHCDRAVATETYLQGGDVTASPVRHLKATRALAYHDAGQIERSLRFVQELLPNPPGVRDGDDVFVLTQYGWLMRLRAAQSGRRQDLETALRVLDRGVAAASATRSWVSALQVERACLHAALGDWENAEKDVDSILSDRDNRDLSSHLEAFLLRGFLLDRRGDRAGAERCWCDGWLLSKRQYAGASLLGCILASLSGAFTDDEARAMVENVMKSTGPFSPIARSISKDLFPASFVAAVVRERWRGPHGREWAQKIAFRTVPIHEYVTVAVPLTVYEGFHQGAVTGQLSPEQDELLWKLAHDLFDAYATRGTVSEAQAFQAALAWKGTTSVLGWGGLQGSLTPELRGPLAYVLGHRYLFLKKKPEAVELFRTALKDASADSPLRRLAQAELDRLSGK